jgi:hypothetical protein
MTNSSSLASVIMSNPQYRLALIYNIVDKEVCRLLDEEFGQAQVRFQTVITKDKIEVIFFFLNRYYLNFVKTNESDVSKSISKKLSEARLGVFKIYYKYRV